jgi:hypothetical protein
VSLKNTLRNKGIHHMNKEISGPLVLVCYLADLLLMKTSNNHN